MKKYRVFASQMVHHYRDIEAETIEEAEALAFEDSNGPDWHDFDYGDWEIKFTREVINENL
jgi:hypothetical protein